MENTILSRLRKAIPDGCSSAECLERVCQEVTYNIVSESCDNAEVRKELKVLCERLRFPIRTQPRPLPVPAAGNALPIKEGIGYALCGIVYFVGYWLSESHWVGGIACVVGGLVYNQFVNRKVEKPALAPSNENPVEILTTDAELAREIERTVQTLTNILHLLEKETPIASENLLENQYFRILSYLYDNYVDYLSSENPDQFQLTAVKNLLNRYGYEFISYAEGRDSYFDSSLAPDIREPRTTIPALVNKKTGDCIFRGHVLFP